MLGNAKRKYSMAQTGTSIDILLTYYAPYIRILNLAYGA